ncbi:CBS domain-containing protein [Aeromicrobium flavum]|uniref:CBS domain-containing protein n=1 Tax=Aeromicrobium flavum TaxID=416568 RepID=UPI0031D955F4
MKGDTARPVPAGPHDAADQRTVAEALVREPWTLPASATVGVARAAFADDHMHMLLLTRGPSLLGTLVRDDLEADVADMAAALTLATLTNRTVAPDVPLEDARRWLVARGERRLAVVDEDRTLLGLLCLKRRQTGFCSDADVVARAAERHATGTLSRAGSEGWR